MQRKEKYQSKFDNLDIPKGHKLTHPYEKKLYKPKALCTQLTTQIPQFLIILKTNHETQKLDPKAIQ